ncbi:MAG: hypothetical protein ACE5IP_10255, partial [Terriglobia bacterium]
MEFRGGEVEEVGGFAQGEVVLETEGAEASGEVVGAPTGSRPGGLEDEAEEGVFVVGGEFLLELAADVRRPSTELRVSAELRVHNNIMEEEERVGVENLLDDADGILSGLVRLQDSGELS